MAKESTLEEELIKLNLDPKNVKCCMHVACTEKSTGKVGSCRNNVGNNCVGGQFKPGLCPGPNDVQCCLPNKQPI
jgi:hypothetical protein